MTSVKGGGSSKYDIADLGGEGVQKWPKFADVICARPLSISTYIEVQIPTLLIVLY